MLKVCTSTTEKPVYIVSENKIYNCTADANYILINDISFSAMDYITDYPEKFTETLPYTWEDNTVQTSEGTFRENFNDNGKKIICIPYTPEDSNRTTNESL